MSVSKQADYEYINDSQIDEELKCTICEQPLQSPVSLVACHHTFCKECIERWLGHTQTCPTCRQSTADNSRHFNRYRVISLQAIPFAPINTRIVVNQLNRLLVRCTLCQKDNIQRGYFKDHEQRCPKKVVSCPSADIKCTWTGPKDELANHVNDCTFHQVRPIIDELRVELQSTRTAQAKLQSSVKVLERQMVFLLTFINRGSPTVQNCGKLADECPYGSDSASNSSDRFSCSICGERIRRHQISLHACSSDCICRECLQKQYPYDYEDNNYDLCDESEHISSSNLENLGEEMLHLFFFESLHNVPNKSDCVLALTSYF